MNRRRMSFAWFCEKFLPFYWQFWPGHWLAIWSAPVLKRGSDWKPKNWRPETHFQALRITLRKGKYGERVWMVVKKRIDLILKSYEHSY